MVVLQLSIELSLRELRKHLNMDIDIEVDQGTVHVNSITVMHESEGCIVYHLDTKTKRPEVEAESNKCIFLAPEEGHSNDYKITSVLFDVPEGWYKVFQAGRYSVQVTFYKRRDVPLEEDEGQDIVWWDEMDLLDDSN